MGRRNKKTDRILIRLVAAIGTVVFLLMWNPIFFWFVFVPLIPAAIILLVVYFKE